MVPVSQDYISSKCEIKTMENILLLTGYINEIDDELNSMEILASADNIAIIKFNTKVKINIFNNKLGFLSVVGETFTSTQRTLKVTNVKLLTDSELRSYFRMGVDDNIYIFKLDENTKGQLEEAKVHEVRMKDVSLGGFRFLASDEIEDIFEGEKYIVDFRFDGIPTIFKFIIRRKTLLNERTYQYGCEFFEGDAKNEQRLCQYMFKVQREQIQKQRERAAML